jgi:hypothetical protein
VIGEHKLAVNAFRVQVCGTHVSKTARHGAPSVDSPLEMWATRPFAESADGDLVAAHIAFGNDYLCTEDRGRSAASPSIFDAENRAWLKTEYRVEILNVQQLANLV